MVFFNLRLLPGSLWIAIENPSPLATVDCVLQIVRSFKLHAIVGKNHREQFAKRGKPKELSQLVKHGFDAFHFAILHEEHEHKVVLTKDHGKDDFALATLAFDCVHFHNGNPGMLPDEVVKILISAPFAVSVLQLCQRLFLFSLPICHFFGKIDVFHIEGPAVNIFVDGALGKTNFRFVGGENVVDGLAFSDEGRNQITDFSQLIRTCTKTFPAFFQGPQIGGVRPVGRVVGMVTLAYFFGPAAGADVGWLVQ